MPAMEDMMDSPRKYCMNRYENWNLKSKSKSGLCTYDTVLNTVDASGRHSRVEESVLVDADANT